MRCALSVFWTLRVGPTLEVSWRTKFKERKETFIAVVYRVSGPLTIHVECGDE